ncbi:protein of unknown function [Burkholderia multivorans]
MIYLYLLHANFIELNRAIFFPICLEWFKH